MKSRVLAFIVAGLLFSPVAVEADRFKPAYPLRSGILVEDTSCPAATHVLLDFCSRAPATYVVFNRVKGLKRFIGEIVLVNGPVETASCSLPLMDVRKIGFAPLAPPPCP